MLDCDGEYYTLKEKLEDVIVIGGQYGDIATSMQGVSLLPREIISNQLSVVIDLSDMKMPDRVCYVKLFLESLMELPQKYWKSYLVFVEEAHKFCGQQDKQESGPAVRDLMSRGRKMGFCGILVTQRISKLHKDAAAECNNKFIGRTGLDLDMDRVSKELGFTKSSEFTRLSLRDLKPRHFYAYGTSINQHYVHTVIIKEAKTRFAKSGSPMDIKPRKPTAKLLSMLDKLNELPKDQEKTERTVEELTNQVTKLQAELRTYTRAGQKQNVQVSSFITDEFAIQKRIDLAVANCKTEFNKELKLAKEKWKTINSSLLRSMHTIKNASLYIIQKWEALTPVDPANVIMPTNAVFVPIDDQDDKKYIVQSDDIIHKPGNVDTSQSLLGHEFSLDQVAAFATTTGAMRILKACAMFGPRPITKVRAAMIARLSHKSGSYNTYLSTLKKSGLITVQGDYIHITQAGRQKAGKVESLPTDPDELINLWCGIIGSENGASRILRQLGRHYPNYLTKGQLANLTSLSHNSGSYNTYLSLLKRNGLISQSGQNIKASDELFHN